MATDGGTVRLTVEGTQNLLTRNLVAAREEHIHLQVERLQSLCRDCLLPWRLRCCRRTIVVVVVVVVVAAQE